MSHFYENSKTKFIYNSDLSGDITIKNDSGELDVDGHELIDFILNHLKREFVSNIDSMSNKEFAERFIFKTKQ